MSNLEEQYYEDRLLRNASRAVLKSDFDHIKSSFSAKGVFSRVGSRIGDGASDVFETAKEQASDNRGIIAALIGAILLWLGRDPIMDVLGLSDGENDEHDADYSDHTRSGESNEY